MSPGPAAVPPAVAGAGEPDPRRWRILAVSQVAGFMSLLDVSIVNVALPSMQTGLHASAAGVQWVVSGYALTFGLALVPAGRLGDALGRRRMFLVALAAFVLTSVLAGAARGEGMLVAARLAQGLAGGMLNPQNSGLIQELFRGVERARAFGIFGATVGLSTAVGPVVGGLILALSGSSDGWRWVFYVNVPIGVLALVLAARLLPRRPPARLASVLPRLDFLGAALLGGAVLAVLFPLVQAEAGGLHRLWWLFPLAAALFAAFARWEVRLARRGRSPLLEPQLLTGTPGYPAGALIGLCYFVGFTGIWLVLALFLQRGLGYSPLHSGLSVTPFSLGSAVAAAAGGRLVSRWGRRITVAGLVLVAFGIAGTAAALVVVDGTAAGLAAALPLLVGGVGGGLVISPNITLTLQSVPTRMAGAAGGALQTGQRIGAAVGTAMLAALYYGVLSGTGDPHTAIGVALAGAAAVTVLALVLATADLRHDRQRRQAPPPGAAGQSRPGQRQAG
jgi:EmrB/QacA subfamily drug resistance transporter